MADWCRAAREEDLPPGAITRIDAEDTPIAVVNLGGEYFAIANLCTHMEAELHEGDLDADGELVCPAHGARFDVRTGEALTPPAFEGLETYPVRVEDGTVYVHPEPFG
ncbi:MAG TPA: non-heme iron oxygenase ferredoxin subunit [Gammaproteobacteria bacterium]|nr:non-heme iron oxygenase ferredoxin subunit [Gammaproteobacteria bacterium]